MCVPGGTLVVKGKVPESVTVTVFAGGTLGGNTNVFVVKVGGFVVKLNVFVEVSVFVVDFVVEAGAFVVEVSAFVVEVNFVVFTVGATKDLIPGSGVEGVTLDEGVALDADSGVCGEVYT